MRKPQELLHMSNTFKSLRHYIGRDLTYIRGLGGENLEVLPVLPVKIIADYPKTVLVEMEFIESYYPQPEITPRRLRWLIPKAALAVNDFTLRDNLTGDFLIRATVTDLTQASTIKIESAIDVAFRK